MRKFRCIQNTLRKESEKMKKTNLVFVAVAAMLLAGCNKSSTPTTPTGDTTPSDTTPTDTTPVHEHSPSAEWSKDETNHWHTCSGCEEVLDLAAHTYVDEVTTPTYEAGGYTTHTCSVCGYSYQDSETAKLEPTELAAPVVTYSEGAGRLVWEEVANAASYKVYDNGEVVVESQTEKEYSLSATVGAHSITVVAVSSAIEYKNSTASTAYEYETKAVALGTVSSEAGKITIADAVGYVTIFNSEGVSVAPLGFNATEYTVSASDSYAVVVSAGYDTTAKVNYAGDAVTKGTVVALNATAVKVLEDGSAESNADLADKYKAQKYSDSWKDSTASIVLDTTNEGVTEGNCVKLNFWNHGAWFKFNTAVSVKDGFDGVSFTIKGKTDGQQFSLVFNDKDGNYASYKLASVPTTWTTYNVRFDAAGWNVNGSGATIAQAAAAKGLTVKQLAATFVSYDLRVYHASDANGSSNALYLDDLNLLPTLASSSVETHVKAYEEYICESGDALIDLKVNGTAVKMIATGFGATNLDFTMAMANGDVTLSNPSIATYVGTLSADGKTITYKSSSGTYASLLEGLNFKAGKLLDNFESYTETGTGYDANHKDPAAVTGLRAAYFSDYYSGNTSNQSPVGGNNWSLMGSSDYVQLDTTNGRGSGKAMKHKVNANTMRVMTMGLANGTAVSQGTAAELHFSIKGNTSGYTINARTFYTKQITPSNQQATDVTKPETLTIAAGSDWVSYSLSLMAKDYYGFGFTFKSGPSSAIYVLIDNMYLVY